MLCLDSPNYCGPLYGAFHLFIMVTGASVRSSSVLFLSVVPKEVLNQYPLNIENARRVQPHCNGVAITVVCIAESVVQQEVQCMWSPYGI